MCKHQEKCAKTGEIQQIFISCSRYPVPFKVFVNYQSICATLMYVEESLYSKPSCETTLLDQVSIATLFLLFHICLAACLHALSLFHQANKPPKLARYLTECLAE